MIHPVVKQFIESLATAIPRRLGPPRDAEVTLILKSLAQAAASAAKMKREGKEEFLDLWNEAMEGPQEDDDENDPSDPR